MAIVQETERRVLPSFVQVCRRSLADALDLYNLPRRWLDQDAIHINMDRLVKANINGGVPLEISSPLQADNLPGLVSLFLFHGTNHKSEIRVTSESKPPLGESVEDTKDLTLTVGMREVHFSIDVGKKTKFVPFTFALRCVLHDLDEGWVVHRVARGSFIQIGRIPQESLVSRWVAGELQGLPSYQVTNMMGEVVNLITNRASLK